MQSNPSQGPAERVLRGGTVLTLDSRSTLATSIAIRGERILATGSDAEMARLVGADADTMDLAGRTVMPGLIDGHAHLDREALKGMLPSLSGIRSIGGLVARLREIASAVPAGHWVVTMPLGDAPRYQCSAAMFEEGRLPNRHDLDRASSDHPILIRPAWGYWSGQLPIVSIANSRALDLAGIGRDTAAPSSKVQIERDASGEPTGVIYENDHMPIAEFTLFRTAPNFTLDDRVRTLAESMRLYNAAGTTSTFEGHGAAPEVIAAYQRLRESNRQTVRSHLTFSPAWSGRSVEDVRAIIGGFGKWLARRGLGDEWLRVGGMYTEIDDTPEGRLRARCAPLTGWAGFCYDAGLPRAAVRELMLEAARHGIRISGIWGNLLDLMEEVNRVVPIAEQRWVLGHQAILDAERIALVRDLGVMLTMHTNAHIHKRGSDLLQQVGPQGENTICPLRSLLDAGVRFCFSTDNVPISLFYPIWEAVERIDLKTGAVIAPGQKLTREEALRCASLHGAALTFEEDEKGSLEPGKLADLIVLDDNPLTVEAVRLRDLAPSLTMVGGKVVHRR